MNRTWQNLESASIQTKEVLEDISIVIPTLGRPILSECLYWISSADYWPGECLIIDQSSNPQVNSWVRILQKIGLNARHISSPKSGKSAGINCAFNLVTTRFVTVTDDDCFTNADWLGRMAHALRLTPEAIITGRVDAEGTEPDFCIVTSQNPKIYKRPSLKVNPLIGGNMGVAMENVKRIGDFDEHPSMIYAAEDRDWGYRALRLGIPIFYNPEIIVRHYSWRDAGQRAARYADYSRGQGAFFGKYLFSGDLLIPMQAGRALIRAPYRWLKGLILKDQDMIDRGRADVLNLIPGILSGMRRLRQL